MEKSYDPVSFESRLYEQWEKNGCFAAQDASEKPAFSMVMPPPNVTGVLHNGHALFVTIQDVLTRWKRMQGYNALWLPGTDHAGIATQMVVERELKKSEKTRHDLGREEFVKRIWEWKEKHGDIIVEQMKKLGASPDWSRIRFTLDEGVSKAVREVFVRLHEEKLIYRGTRIINWCTRCHTALSDLEVNATERAGNFWHIRYRLVDGSGELVIATTRPETLLGDAAVAVHPEDERYKNFIGKKVVLPLLGRELPVIADAYVDKEFGSGALKVTPGHDFNDYELGERHHLPIITVFDKNGVINEIGGPYKGLTIPQAREKVVEDLQAQGLLVRIEPRTHNVGVCQRCERVVEPMVSDQWFVKVKSLAEDALAAVRKGESLTLAQVDAREDAIKILPDTWLGTYYHWMENIKDWCISRQLWWGHQIPAWYCGKCKKITVAKIDPTECSHCSSKDLKQDEDVLDTWFSSALWPFSTLGWPDETVALKTFYPTAVMETGTDILFFWVARMIMMGLHFNEGRVPFKRVYLHALVRDEKGQKMSKTKGNVIDPLDIIRDFGADAFRFSLAAIAGQGRDVRLSLDRVTGYKAFCNKLWNASRYVLLRLENSKIEGDLAARVSAARPKLHAINQWILDRFEKAATVVNQSLDEFRLNDGANEIYSFIWNEYCDWYIEFSKELLQDEKFRDETEMCLAYVLEQALVLAHPFIPFITEEIYQNLPQTRGSQKFLMLQKYPNPSGGATPVAHASVSYASGAAVPTWMESIDKIRAFRGENGVSPKARLKMTYEIQGNDKRFSEGLPFIKALAQLESLDLESGELRGKPTTAEILSQSAKFYVSLAGLVDVDGELKRIEKERATTLSDITHVQAKLGKESFVAKAPKELIESERAKLAGFQEKLKDLDLAAARLGKLSQ